MPPKARPRKGLSAAAKAEIESRQKLREEKDALAQAERERLAREEADALEELRLEKERLELRAQKRAANIAMAKANGTYKSKKAKRLAARTKVIRQALEDQIRVSSRVANLVVASTSSDAEVLNGDAAADRRDAEQAQHHRQATSHEPGAGATAGVPQAVDDDDEDNWETLADASPKNRETDQADVNDEVEATKDDDTDNDLDFLGYRSPVVCIMGHVDTGKTKLLDKIRRTNVQGREPGGITQQIGVTFFPDIALDMQTSKIDEDFEIEVPGMMIIDTPGHQHFSNLRSRGSSLCDIAILVVDIMHGLEPTVVESLELLQQRRCPFIIALNKVDRLYLWRDEHYTDIRSAIDRQADHVKAEFRNRFDKIQLQLAERGLNSYLYWENEDFAKYVSVIPTSAITGEGIPDLLYMILNVCQNVLPEKLEIQEELECTVMEVKDIEGLGTTIDVVLKNGSLRQGDQIVIAGVAGPMVTTIRDLVTPQPMKEMRVKGEYIHHAEISTSLGVKICAPELENAVAGSELFVVGPEDDVEELKAKIEDSFSGDLMDFEKAAEGVYVQASTIGALEALLSFLTDMKIPVFGWGIGEVQLMDVKRASLMKEKKHSEYAVILAFDVKVNKDAQILADSRDIPIFTADIIYHLSDQFKTHMEDIRKAKNDAVFPVVMKIDPKKIFHNKDPLICGVSIVEGQLRIGTPLCLRNGERQVGRVISIEKDNKTLQVARKGLEVSVAIEQFERFDHTRQLYSKITRSSIDSLKALHRDEMRKQDWDLVILLKDIQKIQ